MDYWWLDRTLPGVVGGLVVAAAIAAEHFLMRRHLTRLTHEQTDALVSMRPGEAASAHGSDDPADGLPGE